MAIFEETILSGFVSVIISDCIDVSKSSIKKAINEKFKQHQNVSSNIYKVIINTLNNITYNAYKKDQETIYEAAEILLMSFKKNEVSIPSSIGICLKYLYEKVDNDKIEKFEMSFYQELAKEENAELRRAIDFILQAQRHKTIVASLEEINQKIDKGGQ